VIVKRASHSIRGKLLLAMASVTIGACALLGLSSSLRLRNVTLRQANESILSVTTLTARNLAPGLNSSTRDLVRDAVSGLFGISGVRFVLVQKPDGETFFAMGDSPPFGAERTPSPFPRVQKSPRILIASAPVRDAANCVIGNLLVGYSTESTRRILEANMYWLLAITLALASVSILIGHTLGRLFTTSLLELTESTRKLAAGHFEGPLPVRSDDEVGVLASTFNMMTTRLSASRREIERSHQMLEAKVEERTEELRQKNFALEIQNERVLESSRLKGSFLANVSHELRTPLNAILALSELMKDGLAGDMNEEQKEHVSMIHRSGSALLRLINDILDLSKIEAGRMEIHPIRCDILAEIRRTAIELQPMAAGRGLDLRLAIKEGPQVIVDADRVRQIVVNLLGNALKFTEHGFVAITAGFDDEQFLDISVRDTGIGIAHDNLAAIFQEFRQVDGSTARPYGGTGLGLSISRKLTEMMGGVIEVNSVLGRGSAFRVRIPVQPSREEIGGGETARAA
jgi:signal transduction histidine kinase